MLAPMNEQTGDQNGRAKHGDDRHWIALNGSSALDRLAAGNAREPGALTSRIVAPIRERIADIARYVACIVRQGLADMSGLAAQFADLGGKGVERIVSTAAGCEQIFKMHELLPGYGRNAIGRTQVPYTINDFDPTKMGRTLGIWMAST